MGKKMSREFLYTVKQTFGIIYTWKGLLIVILASVFFAWVPDSLRELLEEVLWFFPKPLRGVIFLTLPLILVILIGYLLKIQLERIAGLIYEVEEDKELCSLTQAKVIFMGYSIPRDLNSLKNYLSELEKKSPEERLKTLEDNKDSFNWIMQAILLKEFLEKSKNIEKVIVIPSEESKNYKEYFIKYLELIKFYEDGVFHFTDSVDYEDVIELQRIFNSEIEKLKSKGIKEKEIFIDVTAGQKTFSIVAASITFESEIKICYVSTQTRKVRVFNIKRIEKEEL